MKLLSRLFGVICFATSLFAQTEPSYSITGDMFIRYDSRQPINKEKEGVYDVYTYKINVANSAVFRGTTKYLPYIHNSISSDQDSLMDVVVDCDIVNPKNISQTKNVGRIIGQVPISYKNVYDYTNSSLKVSILSIGSSPAIDSPFKGTVSGKPPATNGVFSKIKKEVVSVAKLVNGKNVTVKVTDYDRMEFSDFIIGAGPVRIYPEAIVSGSIIYDYSRNVWYFDGLTVSYSVEGRRYSDRLSGDIRWVESPNRAVDGKGEYQFDLRVNEPAQSESAAFGSTPDESAFFSVDNNIPSITGTFAYKDRKVDDNIVDSSVTINLTSNKLTKQQVMYLFKFLFIANIVPFNAE